ncbi:DUF6542 domain-containing protein [Nocardia asteroides]|uniref:DUF6542 domain-containing protein n=1 Tax=Nocardia asteroides TaxID=1824 RepID=UPI001E54A683|nr:DUF6542 domain-containing protein [Nocardia asteroides]UGT57621.1 hypothetical protein LTT85_12600 [Nocardia asteroides]
MAASQRARPRVPAPQRSIVPSVPGIPAWAAIALAAGMTLLGFLIDALGGETYPTGTFSALYVLGCVLAVCAVRFRGLFSAMVLPPLLLFVAVPVACQMLGGRATTSIKDVLMNLVIPLVERFPTMMLATVLVLAIGGARIAIAKRAPATATAERRGERRTERKPTRRRRTAADLADTGRGRGRRGAAVLDDLDTAVDMASPARRPQRQPKRAPDPKRAPAAESKRAAAAEPRRAPAAARTPRGGRAAAPREPEPVRTPRRRPDAPPHPQPNVRYRDRADTGRTERRRPDTV